MNPFEELKKRIQIEQKKVNNNPFSKIRSGETTDIRQLVTDTSTGKKTNFRKIKEAKADAEVAQAESKKANSFKTLAMRTLNPINLAKSGFNLGKQVFQDPVQSAREFALGISNGLTFGATDYLQEKAFMKEATKYGMDEETAKNYADKMLKPQDSELSAIRGGGNIGGMAGAYMMGEGLLLKGMKYANPNFVKSHALGSRFLADLGIGVSYGQLEETFKRPEERQRLARLGIDVGSSVLFFGTTGVFKKLRNTKFKNPLKAGPVGSATPIVDAGQVVSSDNLKSGASKMIKELEAIPNKTDVQKATLKELQESINDPDKLIALQQKGALTNNVGDANTSVTIRVGEDAVQEGAEATGKEVTVATNNLDSLKSYIKGSGDVEYKIIKDGLGVDNAGNKIMARHEFNPSTGKHVIYATDDASASTIAHELGHYFDKNLTKTTQGLSRILKNYDANQEAIEDALGSFSVSRLGGNATSDAISSDIKKVTNSLISETSTLSALRQGGKAQIKSSEQFADAISEILTNPAAARQAPVLTGLLKHLDDINQTALLGKQVTKNIEESGARIIQTQATDTGKKVVSVSVPKVSQSELKVPKELSSVEDVISKFDSKLNKALSKIDGAETAGVKEVFNAKRSIARYEKQIDEVVSGIEDTKLQTKTKEFLNKRVVQAREGLDNFDNAIKNKVAAVKKEGPGAIIEKEVPKKLDRTPTGKKPKTEDIRTEKITNDEVTKKFFDDNITTKVTGKERIGKTNEEIIERSLSSKMTEKDFDKILTERFGNLSEDVVKAKRLMNDKALDIMDNLAGRNIDEIPASELGEITNQMNQIVEMFEVMAGVRTELSNSFRSLGIAVAPGENDILRQVVGQIQTVLGKESDAFGAVMKLRKLRETDVIDKYFTLWYPAILSGPKTTARNIVGTGSNLVTETMSSLFTTSGRKTFGARINGIVGAQKQAWNNAKEIMKGNKELLSKFQDAPPIEREAFKGKFSWLNNIEYVGRFLDGQDAFFSTIAKEGEVAAMRAGDFSYGLTNKALVDEINDSVAQAFAQRVTYRNAFDKTAVGEVAKGITAMKNTDVKPLKFALNHFIPFVKTVANVTDRTFDYLPLVNTMRTFGDNFSVTRAKRVVANLNLTKKLQEEGINQGMDLGAARQWALKETDRIQDIMVQRLKDQQRGKFYMGLTASAMTVPMAMNGMVTGSGPTSRKERETLMSSGWRPNSIKIGDVYLPYQNLGPLSGILSAAGNIADKIKYDNADDTAIMEQFGEGIKSFMESQLDQSFLSGIADFYDMVFGFKSFGDFVEERVASGLPIPAIWTQSADIVNPTVVETNTFFENIQRKLGLKGNLEPRLDAFGKEVSSDLIWGLTPSFLNTNDPVLTWMVDTGISVGKPQKSTKIKSPSGKEEREMTPEEYTEYVRNTGEKLYDKIERKVRTGGFKRFKTKEAIQKEVDKIVTEIREQEKKRFSY